MMLQSILFSMPMFVCAIITAELALSLSRWRDAARKWLLAWAATATLLYGGHFVFFHRLFGLIPLSDTVYVACNLAVYPLYLIYIYRLTCRRVPRWMLSMLALPLVAGVLTGVLYALMDADTTCRFIEHYLYRDTFAELSGTAYAQAVAHTVCKALFSIEVMLVVTLGIRRIRQYNHLVDSLYADTEHKSLDAIRIILILLVVTAVFSVLANTIGRAWFADSVWLTAIPSFVFSLLLFAIGWQGLWQTFTIDDIARDEAPMHAQDDPSALPEAAHPSASEHDADSPVPPSARHAVSHAIRARLEEVMRSEHLYLQPNLKLDDLASRLGTNRTYLLRCMKEEFDMTFTEYVNRLRIADACKISREQPALSRTEIAQRVGYQSMTSFYRNWNLYATDAMQMPTAMR